MTTTKTTWVIQVPLLPPSVNEMYGVSPTGRRYMTEETKAKRMLFQLFRNRERFTPDPTKHYRVDITFWMGAASDWDNRIKALCDFVFGPRMDQRITMGTVEKVVSKRKDWRTVIIIEEEA